MLTRLHNESPAKKLRIGEMLVAEGLITDQQLSDALARMREKGGRTVENLMALDYLNQSDFVRFLSRQPGVASIDLFNYTIPRETIDLISPKFAFENELLPIDKLGKHLTVAMACPLDSATIQQIGEMTGLRVRPLLVSMNDIRAALDRYYGSVQGQSAELDVGLPAEGASPGAADAGLLSQVESALTFERILSLVREVTVLPALPETVTEVRRAMEDIETSVSDVAGILSRDPALSAKLLSLANSAAFSFAHRVDSVELAVSLLGLREVYGVVLSAAVVDYFDKSAQFDYKHFWKRSILCATISRLAGKACGQRSNRALFAAGLLHDLGKVVLAQVASAGYAAIDQSMPEAEIIEKEKEIFGIAHPEIGFILAQCWELPEDIAVPIRFHHDVASANDFQALVAIVALASGLTDLLLKGEDALAAEGVETCGPLLPYLGLNEAALARLFEEAAAAAREALAE